MELEKDVPVSDSPFEETVFSVDLDPEKGGLTVRLNGSERLAFEGAGLAGEGAFVVFRSLDRAEFRNFRVERIWR